MSLYDNIAHTLNAEISTYPTTELKPSVQYATIVGALNNILASATRFHFLCSCVAV